MNEKMEVSNNTNENFNLNDITPHINLNSKTNVIANNNISLNNTNIMTNIDLTSNLYNSNIIPNLVDNIPISGK